MKPEDDKPTLSIPSRQNTMIPSRDSSAAQKQAAANVVRSQIANIYQNDPHTTAPVAENTQKDPAASTEPANQTAYPRPTGTIQETSNQKSEPVVAAGPGAVDPTNNPYARTLQDNSKPQTHAADWGKYHSAWQSYYQQYYERYYTSQVHAAHKSMRAEVESHKSTIQDLKNKAAKQKTDTDDGSMTQEEAIQDLRSSIRKKVNERAKKMRKSRHFMPIMAAVVVMLVFLFLQYNRVLFAYVEAYVSPGAMSGESIIVSPDTSTVASDESKLLIPKIAVDVPLVWDADAASQDSLNAAMDKGVVWFNIQGASAKPGEKGNFVLSGHSSNDWVGGGDYKFIFARLERMKAGDIVYVNHEGTRYTYKITGTKVVKPTDVSALYIGDDKPYITLITCTPLGTARDRLLVFGEQISPDPDQAAEATEKSDSSSSASKMPSNSPTFLQRIFGLDN